MKVHIRLRERFIITVLPVILMIILLILLTSACNSRAVVHFTSRIPLPDLAVGTIRSSGNRMTRTLDLFACNVGNASSITSTISFRDGESNNSNIFSEITLPPLEPNRCHAVTATWDMSGPGLHKLYGIIDAEQRILEADKSNNVNYVELIVPDFVLQPTTDASVYDLDSTIFITTQIINLHPDIGLRLGLTTTISSDWISPSDIPQFHYQDTQTITVPANGHVLVKAFWTSTNARGSRSYRVNVTGRTDNGNIQQLSIPFQIRYSINFMANPLSGNAPLGVYFVDLSTPIDAARNLDWNFGDGSPSIVAEMPFHTYTTPGVYTVTMTATNSISNAVKIKPNYIEVHPTP